VVADLSRDRHVVAYDQRGHGDSTNTGRAESFTVERLVADLAAVIAAKQLAPLDLLGHSMGGIVAMRFALDHPEQLRSLILMDTFAAPTGNLSGTWIDYVLDLARKQGMAAVADLFLGYVDQAPGADKLPPERVAELRERIRYKLTHMDVEALEALGRGLGSFDSLADDVAGIALPTTVIVGESDVGLRDAADMLATTIPAAVLEVIPAAGHSPQEDNPTAWLAAVRGHLARVS